MYVPVGVAEKARLVVGMSLTGPSIVVSGAEEPKQVMSAPYEPVPCCVPADKDRSKSIVEKRNRRRNQIRSFVKALAGC